MKRWVSIYKISLITLLLAGCFNSVSEYDAISYKNLMDLKSNMKASFDTYTVSGAKGESDLNTFKKFKTDISNDYDYARGKEKNENVINQWGVLNSQVDEMVQTFQQNDSLTSGYCLEKWRVIEDALNKAIDTKGKDLNK